jgi:hypothetical protein
VFTDSGDAEQMIIRISAVHPHGNSDNVFEFICKYSWIHLNFCGFDLGGDPYEGSSTHEWHLIAHNITSAIHILAWKKYQVSHHTCKVPGRVDSVRLGLQGLQAG